MYVVCFSRKSKTFDYSFLSTIATVVYILEVEKGTNSQFQKKAVDLVFPPEAAADFPVAVQVAQKYIFYIIIIVVVIVVVVDIVCVLFRYGIVFVMTKFGYVHLFDLGSGKH